ncbi:MAG: ABC transporter substrate-binding protein [Oscillospiraceae bacterium]|jgi:peptide/nickel transport system substrate-binding protein|nr:ABC transporter substrate-binding protein [Oscillospiraceae bacterium]
MKKVLAIFLVFCVAFTLFSCGKGGSETPAGEASGGGDDATATGGGQAEESPSVEPGNVSAVRDTLNVAMTQDRGTLDPSYMMGYDLLNAMRMVYDVLWDIDGEGNQIWLLATDLEVVEPTVWHVTLRQGVTFANGNPFTADDVLFSLYRGNNRTGEPATFPVLNLEKSKALDEYTVEIVFDSYELSYRNGFSLLYIYDAESFDEETAATTPNGTGPYEVTDYVINSHLDLTVRDGYWGEKPAIENLHFAIMSEDTQRVTALQTGLVDIASVPYQDIEFVQTLSDLTVVVTSPAMSKALYFNPAETSVFYDNPDARKAVALAIDTQAIADIAYSGFAKVSRMPVAVDNIDAEDRFMDLGVYGIGYDPELAGEYAEKSGLRDKEILLINNGTSDSQVVAELIQANLKEIGVTVNVQNLDPGSWLSIVFDDTQYDVAVDFTTAPSMTLAQNYYSWINYHVGGAYTRNPWPGKDRALELAGKVMSVSDPQELSEIYMELTTLQTEAMLWFSLVDMTQAAAYNSGLSGYNPLLFGNVNYAGLSWAA